MKIDTNDQMDTNVIKKIEKEKNFGQLRLFLLIILKKNIFFILSTRLVKILIGFIDIFL